ncbi:nuclear transport factor 2 family protein [Burkholderia sp. 22PA0106]|uniref:nuclear transport factor 2 family protein n=1 Tax=Burkholderia sp. 22PA0106 TaxID=3237371 RepID=UPI0039C0F768
MTHAVNPHHAASIRALIEHWALDRDEGRWESLLDAYSENGQMVTSWATLPAPDFVAACRNGMNQGHYEVLHEFGASRVDIVGERALAATKMKIMLRGHLHGIEVDVTAWGVARDRLVLTPHGWKIALRRTVYHKSRIDPVQPDARMSLDAAGLDPYPPAYRHLAYFQVAHGAKVPTDLLTPESENLRVFTASDDLWLREGQAR